jgi:hypothetical protein
VKRTGNPVKDKRLGSLAAVKRRIGILTSPEPWRFFGDAETRAKGPDSYVCCAGTRYNECGCGGMTMREDTEQRRKNLPPIESIRVASRQVTRTPWVEIEDAPSV